jgi:hypothetical protein
LAQIWQYGRDYAHEVTHLVGILAL